MTVPDLLPDSRSRERRGAIRSPQGTLIPVYCANCGKRWGMVPEEFITFDFCLCDPCADKYGNIAHTYREPDAVFWDRIAEAQREEHGHFLTLEELTRELADPASTMSQLAREWQAHVRKTVR